MRQRKYIHECILHTSTMHTYNTYLRNSYILLVRTKTLWLFGNVRKIRCPLCTCLYEYINISLYCLVLFSVFIYGHPRKSRRFTIWYAWRWESGLVRFSRISEQREIRRDLFLQLISLFLNPSVASVKLEKKAPRLERLYMKHNNKQHSQRLVPCLYHQQQQTPNRGNYCQQPKQYTKTNRGKNKNIFSLRLLVFRAVRGHERACERGPTATKTIHLFYLRFLFRAVRGHELARGPDHVGEEVGLERGHRRVLQVQLVYECKQENRE